MRKISRRSFLSLATTAGVGAVVAPLGDKANKLIPYVIPPSYPPVGKWALYATTCRECPAGCGMHLWHRNGRVTKAEGNPDHPINHGGLCPRGQSSLQGLYDPDRLKRILPTRFPALDVNWNDALNTIGTSLKDRPGRVAVLSDMQTGALAEVINEFAAAFGGQAIFWEPLDYSAMGQSNKALFNRPDIPAYRLENCDFIISFGADFLETWISPVEYAAGFTEMHVYRDGRMGRCAYVGPRLSMTAANADDFILVPPDKMLSVAVAIAQRVIELGLARTDAASVHSVLHELTGRAGPIPENVKPERIDELAIAFAKAGKSVALAGPACVTGQSGADVAMAASILNYLAGRIGTTVDFSAPHALSRAASSIEVAAFLKELGPKDTLIVHCANPAYALDVKKALGQVGMIVHLGTMRDETAELARWVLPIDSPLESWGDYDPRQGIHSLMQPTMARLYDTRMAGDVLLDLARAAGSPLKRAGAAAPAENFQKWLELRWRELHARLSPATDFSTFWVNALRAGGVWETPPRVSVAINVNQLPPTDDNAVLEAPKLQLWTWPSIMLADGRVSNRGWLQEAPDPTTTITWGSWIEIHPRTAAGLGLRQSEICVLNDDPKMRAPVLLTEDIAEHTIAIPFGQGHTALGRNAAGRGVNAFRLSPFSKIAGTGQIVPPIFLSATQEQHGREIIQAIPLSRLREMKPGDGNKLTLPLPEGYDPKRDLYKGHEHKNHRWAMVADIHRCIGCGACAVACYAENNIPVMGAEQMIRGREMAWMKVVPYRLENSSRLAWLPLCCQQCDAAPCEPVCPVFASVHNEEGLNAQVYNRCIGTRYCSNNCPYKVRRFNWLNVEWPSPLEMQLNPEVTVRSRGVMEKCNFCIQRIRNAEHQARREGRALHDGEIQPACVQSCPTRALVFGDLMLEDSEVNRLTRLDPRRYHVLEELNTKPAITYLMRIEQDEHG